MKWISVKDKLPEFNTWVLTYVEDEHNSFKNSVVGTQKYQVKYYYEVNMPDISPYYTNWTGFGDVTHWMALPLYPEHRNE